MEQHQASGTLHIYDVKCGYCKKEFRTESDIDEPPRHATCRHCHKGMYDDDDITYSDSKYVGYVIIDLFSLQVIKQKIFREKS